LKTVQSNNNQSVNETLNEIYLEEEDYDNLRKSIVAYESFEPNGLAKATEKHQLLEMRRIAAYLYRKIGKYQISVQISNQDKYYRDSIETAQESGKPEYVEELLRFFVLNNEKEYFTVCLYTCYELIRPDVAMELSWRFGMMEYAMPFFIQISRELTSKIDHV
jgi:clathrin heavy chain